MQSSFQNAFNMKARWLFLHQQDTFDDEEKVEALREYPLHVYLICRSPVIALDSEKTKISDSELSLTFYTNLKGQRKELSIRTINNPSAKIGSITTEYPHKIVTAFKPDGSEHSLHKANLLLRYLSFQQDLYFDELNMEVLYVGQAFGDNGSRITVDRLRSHEKAQKIYFETQERFPDHEVWFLAVTFEPELITMFKPWGDVDPDLFEEELANQEKVESNPLSFDQQITIAEATLIRYFNTVEYNKEYLNFPSSSHSSYGDLYKLDFNTTAIELTTTSIYTKLWSKEVPPAFIHYRPYFLHNESERRSMLNWFE